MRKILQISLVLLFLFVLAGCGKTNFLQWAAPAPSNDNITVARRALDRANYRRALDLVKDDDSDEARIVYAQALLGLADIDLASIMDALDDDTVTDNPIIRLDKLMHGKGNVKTIILSGDIFLEVTPELKSDKVIGVLSTMAAHTANLKQAFDPSDKGLDEAISGFMNNIDVSEQYKKVCIDDDLTSSLRYILRAKELLALSVNEKNIVQAIDEMRDTMASVNAMVSANGSLINHVEWGWVRAIFNITD